MAPTKWQLRSEKAAKKLRRATSLLWAAFVTGCVTAFVFLVAMSTAGWVTVDLPSGTFRNSTQTYVIKHYAGLWKKCWVEWDNSTMPIIQREYCRMKKFFPSQQTIANDAELDNTLLDYSRSEAALSVISLLIAAMANFFTWYSIQEPRYMFKRLAGSLHFITGGCIVVCVEVFRGSLDYRSRNMGASLLSGAVLQYGYSMYLAWICTAVCVLVGVTMFVLSAKKKGDKARSDEEAFENEPVIIGRI